MASGSFQGQNQIGHILIIIFIRLHLKNISGVRNGKFTIYINYKIYTLKKYWKLMYSLLLEEVEMASK